MKRRLFASFVLISVASVTHGLLAEDDSKPAATPAPALGQTNSSSTSQPAASPRSTASVKEKPANQTELSSWTADVAKLSDADVDDDIIYSFIDNSGTFNLDADQIIRLRQKGVPTKFIVAMIQHDTDVTTGNRPLTISSAPSTRPSIQFVLVPKDTSKNKNPSSSSDAAPANESMSAETQSLYDDVLRFVDWEDLSVAQSSS